MNNVIFYIKKAVTLLICVGLLGAFISSMIVRDPYAQAPDGVISEPPLQTPIHIQPFEFANYNYISSKYLIKPLAAYDLKGRVLHTRRYYSDAYTGDLVPFDFGIGWQTMSDLSVLRRSFDFEHVHLSGGARGLKFTWKLDERGGIYLPPNAGNIEEMFGNNHLIPADKSIYRQLASVKAGDLVRLKGYLVSVEDEKGQNVVMSSSLSRKDTATHWGGNNSNCEVMFVTLAERIISLDPFVTEPLPESWVLF